MWNFIGTYTSRYTEYEGYWLFGMIVDDIKLMYIDLLVPPDAVGTTPLDEVSRLARRKFREQVNKSGLPMSYVQEGQLVITKGCPATVHLSCCRTEGYRVEFKVRVVSDRGGVYENEATVLVAPHDSTKMFRSTRWSEVKRNGNAMSGVSETPAAD